MRWALVFIGFVVFIYCYWQCKFGNQKIEWPGILYIPGVFVGLAILGYGVVLLVE